VPLAALGGARLTAPASVVSFQGGGGGAHQPAVDREPFAAGHLLDPGLELVREAQVDPGHLVGPGRRGGTSRERIVKKIRLVGFGWLAGRWLGRGWRDDEFRFPPAQPQFD
jgi:hypothetical protein